MRIIRGLAGFLGGSVFLGAMIYGYLTGFVRSYDKDIGRYVDGVGRELSEVPFGARFFVPDSLWPGFGLYLMDAVIFFGSMGIAFTLISVATSNSDSTD